MTAATKRNVSLMYRRNAQAALMRRLYPATALHRKVLAHAIGRHVDTINRIMAGEGRPSLEVIGDIGKFFRAQNDPLFLTEVFGPEEFPPPSAPVAAALAALDQARAALLETAAA